ncbi:MAG: RNA polymerase factor sigma-54 [Candidatus Eisenbacteria bacterium]|nr:RNA polymerase factor sigma-54 [Candidatus Eisenbacteria bacterium]
MEMKHQIYLTQKPTLVMTQRLQQALKLLQVPTLELQQILKQELMANPVLEEVEETEVQPTERAEEEEEKAKDEDKNEVDWSEFWPDSNEYAAPRSYEASSEEFYERTPVTKLSLRDLLLSQARLTLTTPEDQEIAEEILGSIDEAGYLVLHEPDESGKLRKVEDPVADIASRLGKPAEKVLEVLRRIQEFEPAGVGARDLQECLLIQLRAKGVEDGLPSRILNECFEMFKARKGAEISRILKESPQKIQDAFDAIASLDPKPGMTVSGDEARYVVPDLVVDKVADEYVIFLNDRNVPRLRINPSYRELLSKENKNSEAKKFIQGKLNSAKWFIQTIEQRRRTMVKVMKTIVEEQKEFFEKGPGFLKPLTLQQIANEISMHESTVSRVTNGKYVQTPRGVFELKYFFSSRLETEDGEGASAKSARGSILKMVQEEDKKAPLSDHEIAARLRERGLRIARRTVAKYRELLGILPARYRKRV